MNDKSSQKEKISLKWVITAVVVPVIIAVISAFSLYVSNKSSDKAETKAINKAQQHSIPSAEDMKAATGVLNK